MTRTPTSTGLGLALALVSMMSLAAGCGGGSELHVDGLVDVVDTQDASDEGQLDVSGAGDADPEIASPGDAGGDTDATADAPDADTLMDAGSDVTDAVTPPDVPLDGATDAPDADPADTGPDVPPLVTFDLACETHADCQPGCASGACVQGTCVFSAPQASCVQPDAAGLVGTCVAPFTPSPTNPCLVCNPGLSVDGWAAELAATGFEGDLGPLTLEGLPGKATWTVSTDRAASGLSSAYFGVPGAATYATGARAHGRLVSAPIPVAPGVTPTVSFSVWLESEATKNYDFLRILAEPVGGTPMVIWHSNAVGGTTGGEFLPVHAPIAGLGGKTFRLVVEFDSVDELINGYEGAYVDDLRLSTGCCATDGDCDDANPCTTDHCPGEGLACVHTPIAGCCASDGDCDDGDLCTADACSGLGGACTHEPIAGCCHADKDCGDGDPCTKDVCGAGNACSHQPLCCETAADCDDGDKCTAASCTEGQCVYEDTCCKSNGDCSDGEYCTNDLCVDGACVHAPASLPGCCNPDILVEGFDEGEPAGWTFSAPTGGVGWQVYEGAQVKSAPGALYFGNPATMTFNSGGVSKGTALSGPITLPDGVSVTLTFDVYFSGESGTFWDNVWLEALTPGSKFTIAPKSSFLLNGWKAVTVDLSYLAGQTIQLQWNFDSGDTSSNDGLGALVDNFILKTSCEPKSCTTSANCGSLDPCLAGSCNGGQCEYVSSCCAADAECDDGLVCTTDSCKGGKCSFVKTAGCCETVADCDDKNACTTDACSGFGGQCSNTAVEGCCLNNAGCNDGDKCTTDICKDNACHHTYICCGSDAECNDGDDVCTLDQCINQFCKFTLTDQPGCCTPQLFVDAFDQGALMGWTTSAPTGGVGWQLYEGNQVKSAPGALYFGNPATMTFNSGGTSKGTATSQPIDLPEGLAMSLSFDIYFAGESGTYDNVWLEAKTGTSKFTIAPKSLFTVNGWKAVTVDLSFLSGQTIELVWNFDSGDSVSNDGLGALIDNFALTTTCAEKACTASANCGSLDPCLAGACDGGTCKYVSACCKSGDECDDGLVCTTDSCINGKCSFAKAKNCCETELDCHDGNPCTADTCTGFGGQCEHTSIAGCCLGAADCNDGDACTTDACVANVCQNAYVCCTTDGQCDDGDDVCTVDTCVGGFCQFGFSGAEGCCDQQPVAWDFETPVDFTVTGSSTACKWQVANAAQSVSGGGTLYYGDLASGDYDCGDNSGQAVSAPIALQPGVPYMLTFQLYMDTESSTSYDKLNVWAVSNGKTIALWDKSKLADTWEWTTVKVDLSAFAGQTLQLRFNFDTEDGTANSGEGVFIDDLVIDSTCAPKACTGAAQCSDGLTGTKDECQGGVCSWTF